MSEAVRTDDRTVRQSQRSKALYDRARRVLAGGVNHNLRKIEPYPLYFARGKGPRKWDVDGNEYVDYALGSGALMLGHAPSVIADAIHDVFEHGIPAMCHELEIIWAERVRDLIPSAERVRFVSSGTEATLLAIRLARAYTERDAIVRFQGAYHGWHDYGMIGHRPPFDQPASAGVPASTLESVVVATPDLDEVGRLLASGTIAAVMVEPSGPGWGTVPLEHGFLDELRRLTERTETLLLFDEVITGFRFASGGAQARYGVTPDLTTLGKIVAGGFPGGAVGGRQEIMALLDARDAGRSRYVFHYGTHNGHPLSAAAGVAMLSEIATGMPNSAADAYASDLRASIAESIASLGIGGFVYGESSVFHLFLSTPGVGWDGCADSVTPEALLTIPPTVIEALQAELRARGVDLMSYNGGMVSAAHGPPELEESVRAFTGALRALRDANLVAS